METRDKDEALDTFNAGQINTQYMEKVGHRGGIENDGQILLCTVIHSCRQGVFEKRLALPVHTRAASTTKLLRRKGCMSPASRGSSCWYYVTTLQELVPVFTCIHFCPHKSVNS